MTAREQLAIAPQGWLGPRGNFAPPEAADPFLAYPRCLETLFTEPPGLLNLDTGAPCQRLLTRGQEVLQEGMARWLTQEGAHKAMQYGPVEGTLAFRQALGSFLEKQYGDSVDADCLFQTHGATHGLALALQVFFGRASAKVAFIEDPTYFLAPAMLREQGFDLVPVPMAGAQGMDLDALEAEVCAAKAAGRLGASGAEFAGVVYCIPTFHNPTGSVMPVASRQRLVEIAQRYNLLVVSDDVYELLRYPASADESFPQRLVSYDTGAGHVLANGTFSKILGPGVRCGWIEAAPRLVQRLATSATVSSSGASAQLPGALIAAAIEAGALEALLEETRRTYAERMAAVQAASQELPPGCHLRVPAGGMCAWLELPPDVDSHAVLVAARARGVSFKPGDLFSPSGSQRNCARIVVAHYESETLVSAMETLIDVLDEYLGFMKGCGGSVSGVSTASTE